LDALVAKFKIPECEFDVNAQDALGWAPLHCAAWVGDLETTTALIEKGAQLNVQTTYGLTPFHVAAAQDNNKELVVAFLDRGVDIDARTNDGWTALHASVRFEGPCEETAGILLDQRADIKLSDKSGWTSLHYLTYFGGAKDILHELTRRGVDINQEDIRGRRAIYYAIRNGNNFVRIFLSAQMAHDPSE
jgi:ankyrin repeat protein